ncbi:MAG: ABC transporter permease [Oscillibacter sp.]|nr:ABC transporter permease [Oscillibacter sp.]
MRKSLLYPRLAWNNLKKNKKFYLPYLLACMGTVMMFCVLLTLEGDPALDNQTSVRATLQLGTVVVGIFSAIILFYTNSVLTKQRKKEFGLYNILGMEKRHIGRVLLYESLYTAVMSLAGGLIGSFVFSKLLQLMLLKMLKLTADFALRIDPNAIGTTALLFAAIFLLIYLNTVRIIRFAKPVDLLHGSSEGEREPKSKWLLAILGTGCLATGYALSLMTKSAAAALMLFFVAVLFVIAGTYLLFTAFSIVFLKALRRNKNYYYKTKHFATVSGMLYRMKRNAAGLASICILSTMVLVTVSTTVCLYLGVGDMVRQQHPTEIAVEYYDLTQEQLIQSAQNVWNIIEAQGRTVLDAHSYPYLQFGSQRQGDELILQERSSSQMGLDTLTMVWITDAEGYSNLTGINTTVLPGQVLAWSDGAPLDDTVQLMGNTYSVKTLDSFPVSGGYLSLNVKTVYLVVDSEATLNAIEAQEQQIYYNSGSSIAYAITCNLDGTDEEKIACGDAVGRGISMENIGYSFSARQVDYQDQLGFYGTFFFIGMFLGLLFLLATVLIIYYKQASEGYDDRERFVIMQKVGMTEKEVKGTIHSQVLIVFFLPLVTAAIHICFAFPMIHRILMAFGMMNVSLFVCCTAASLLIFAALYTVVYMLTSRTYYAIVSGSDTNN